jgi:MMP 1-O-methyltransferase
MRGFRYSCILPYASIDGWLTVDEAVALLELAEGLPHESPRAVEIGCWQGKSTVCLAEGLKNKKSPQLTCIDPFDASGDIASESMYGEREKVLEAPLRATFEANLIETNVREIVDVRPGYSYDHADKYQDSIDLLFLDGDHSYAAIRRDYEDWSPKVRAGGFLAMHDVVHPVHTGPKRIVDELVADDPQWTDHRYVDSMFVARKAHN